MAEAKCANEFKRCLGFSLEKERTRGLCLEKQEGGIKIKPRDGGLLCRVASACSWLLLFVFFHLTVTDINVIKRCGNYWRAVQ